MKTYIIEQYELHSQKYIIEAENQVDAIKGLFDGQATATDGTEYVMTAHEYYQPDILLSRDELDEIDTFSTLEDDCVTSIRSIKEE